MYNVMGLSLELINEDQIGTCCEEFDKCYENFEICPIILKIGWKLSR